MCSAAFREKTITDIQAHMRGCADRGYPLRTNYFGQMLTGSRYWMVTSEQSTIFITDDHGFFRLYYQSSDTADLSELLQQLTLPGITVTAYVTRSVDSATDKAFQDANHKTYALYRRMCTRSLRVCKTNKHLEFAAEDDVEELQQRLRTDFAPGYADHLPSPAMLGEYVRRRWVLVNRRHGVVNGYLIFQVAGRQVNYNYVFSDSTNPADFAMLQENFYGLAAEQHIQSGILWVNEANTAVIRMHNLFKWRFDGLMCQYYVHTPKT